MLKSPRRIALVAGLAIAAGTVPLLAQGSGPALGTPDLSRVTAGTYQVDPEHTLVLFEVDHLGITPYFGIFGQVTGSLTLDPKNISAARGEFTIPISKVTTASPGLNSHLLRGPKDANGKPDFFGPNPQNARFVITGVTPDREDKNEAKIAGNLTLNGITRPVTLDAKFYGAGKAPPQMGGKENIGFEAEAKMKRSDFKIDMGIPMVSDEVELDIVAAFTK